MFKKAVEFDPGYAAAYAMSASTYQSNLAVRGAIPTPEMRADALGDANIALALTNDDAFVLTRCAKVLAYIGEEFDRGALLVERAVALNPNLAVAWVDRGWISLMRGEGKRASRASRRCSG